MRDYDEPTRQPAATPAVDPTRTIIDTVRDLMVPSIQAVNNPNRRGDPQIPYVILPEGLKVHSLKPIIDEFATDRPSRREGTAHLETLDAMIAHAIRFKDDRSALFASMKGGAPSLTSVLDYHGAGDVPPSWGGHRGVYDFPLSKEWKAWSKLDDQQLGQVDFAEALEDRITDVLPVPDWAVPGSKAKPKTPAEEELAQLLVTIGGHLAGDQKLMELARGLQINDQQKVSSVTSLQTGEAKLVFESSHTDAAGKPLTIPNLFVIAIPVFEGGERYRIPVRLRYRLRGGAVTWILKRHQADFYLRHAAEEAFAKAEEQTGLPLYRGSPE